MAFWDFLKGTAPGIQNVNQYTPQAQAGLQQLISTGTQGLQDPYQGWAPIEAQARQSFAQQTVPGLAERFTSMGGFGGSNALSSPSFASQLGQAGAGLEGQLAGLKSQYGMENRGQSASILGAGIQPQFKSFEQPGQQGFIERFGPSIMEMLQRAGAAYATGGASEAGNVLQEIVKLMGTH